WIAIPTREFMEKITVPMAIAMLLELQSFVQRYQGMYHPTVREPVEEGVDVGTRLLMPLVGDAVQHVREGTLVVRQLVASVCDWVLIDFQKMGLCKVTSQFSEFGQEIEVTEIGRTLPIQSVSYRRVPDGDGFEICLS